MKKEELKKLRAKDMKELEKVLNESQKQLGESSLKIVGAKEKNLKKVRNLRRDIAQILTIVREKELTQ